MAWNVLNFGKHKDKTLPQVLFADPDWFFWAYGKGVFKSRSSLSAQSEDIYKKATHVKVKQPGKEKMVVEHYIHHPTMKYSHFTIVPATRAAHVGSSPTFREDVIDMSAPRRFAKYDKTGCKSLVSSLKHHCFGSKSERMTKKKCEAFFDDSANFT